MSLNVDWTQCAQTPDGHEFQNEVFTVGMLMSLVGIQRLDNVAEFMTRVRIFERVTGDTFIRYDGEPAPVPVELARKWEGLSANIVPKTRTRFTNDLCKQEFRNIDNNTRKEVNDG